MTSIEAQRHPDHAAVMAFDDPVVANVASVDFTRRTGLKVERSASRLM